MVSVTYMDFTKLWDSVYLFGPNPLDLSRSDLFFFWIAVGLVVAAVAIKILVMRQAKESPRRYLFGRFFHLFLTISLLALLWAGARSENIPWLSAHVVVLVLFLGGLVWLGFIIVYFFREHRWRQKRWQEELVKRKYLP